MKTKEINQFIKVTNLTLKLKKENTQIFYALKDLLFTIKKENH